MSCLSSVIGARAPKNCDLVAAAVKHREETENYGLVTFQAEEYFVGIACGTTAAEEDTSAASSCESKWARYLRIRKQH